MFTGIVTDVGTVEALEGDGDVRVTIQTSYDTSGIEIGASIACSGVCLTVVDKGSEWFAADVSRETFSVTSLSEWRKGALVNLERSLKVGDELGGHIVTGHVDCVGGISRFESVDDSIRMEISLSKKFGGYVAKKGSIAVNGVSLTVNEVSDTDTATLFTVNLIPHTQEVTAFRVTEKGDAVNLEFDVLARYVARLQGVA